jgi:diguanylate cyclase (GGDEF)-like protein
MKNIILLIDDSLNTINFIKEQIKEENILLEIISCSNYKEAAEKIELFKKDILVSITDIHLSDSDNGEIVSLLLDNKITTIVLTSTLNKELEKIIKSKKIIEFIQKNDLYSMKYAIESVKRLISNQKETVIVIDNKLNLINSYIHYLRDIKLNIEIFPNEEEALVYILDNIENVKLILTEFSYSNTNAYNTILKIREVYRKDKIGIIVFSDINDTNIIYKSLKFGANDFIFVPATTEEFYLKINLNLELLKNFKKMEDYANKDPLTDMFNRRFFFESGKMLLRESKRQNQNLSYLLIDIDHFKKVNDTYGHDVGDKVIIETSKILQKHIRNSDLLCRYGGEEFAFILNLEDKKIVNNICLKIKDKIQSIQMKIEGVPLNFTVSIGVFVGNVNTIEEGLKKADDALYYSKNNGRNQVTFFNDISNK